MLISSNKNPTIKHIKFLRERKEREQSQEFLVEGYRELTSALRNGYELLRVVYCQSILSDKTATLLKDISTNKHIEVTEEIFDKIAIRVNTGGILGIFRIKIPTFDLNKLRDGQSIVIIDGVEKPGNLGAILRTADATKIACVFVINSNLDVFNPNVIRASLGTSFSVPCINIQTQELIEQCRKNKVTLFALTPHAAKSYLDIQFPTKTALVFGAEATGLSPDMANACDHNVLIPMYGQVDSLNLSVSAGVLMYHLLAKV